MDELNELPTPANEKAKTQEPIIDRTESQRKQDREFATLILSQDFAEDYLEALVGMAYDRLPGWDPETQKAFKEMEKQANAKQPLDAVVDIVTFLRKANGGRNPFDAAMEYWEQAIGAEHLKKLEEFSREQPDPGQVEETHMRLRQVEEIGQRYQRLKRGFLQSRTV